MFFTSSLLLVLVVVCYGNPTGSSHNQVIIRPDMAIKDEGEVALILCTWKHEPLTQCAFKLPRLQEGGQPSKIILSEKSPNTHGIAYYGEGLQKGECGVKLTVTAKDHGNITCDLTGTSSIILEATMQLVVAIKPKEPVLSLGSVSAVEGSNVTATCEVAGGRPAAHITWAFEGKEDFNEIIKQHYDRTETPVGDTTTVMEQVTWPVSADDDQKLVTCSARHYSWKNGDKVATKTLTVHYKPRIFNVKNEMQEDILYPNLVVGETATLIIQIKSNPAPAPKGVQTTIDNTTLTVGQDGDEKYQLSSLGEENGYHLYNVIIKNLTTEDLNKVCTFSVTNSVGSSVARLTFRTRLPSVTDTTPSTEKQKERAIAGSTLIGVIIAVSVIIILLIGLLIFAKFNKKWCFASKPPVHSGQLVPSE